MGERKVRTLLRAGAAVVLVAPRATPVLRDLGASGRIRWHERGFEAEDLRGALLAVAATDDEALNGRIVAAAGTRGILVCDASSAHRSQVIFGALHGGPGVTVAVFTDGEDPSRARRVRDHIAGMLPPEEDSGARGSP